MVDQTNEVMRIHRTAQSQANNVKLFDLDRAQTLRMKLADLLAARKGKIASLDIQRRQGGRCSAIRERAQNFAQTMCAMTLGANNKLMQGFTAANLQAIAKNSLSLIDFGHHVVDGQARMRLSVKHLPEGGHHSAISR
jgi:hypothetical protein